MTIAEQIAAFDAINRKRSLTDSESRALEKLIRIERGIRGGPRGGRMPIVFTPRMDAALCDLRAKGWGLNAIAGEIGVCKRVVSRRVDELKLPRFKVGGGPGRPSERAL